MSPERASKTHRLVRPVYLGLGMLFVALGYIGVIVPVMPSTIFFILALWAFQKSSPKFEEWLLYRSFIGPTLRDWRENGSVRPRTKVIAISLIWVSILSSCAVLVARERPIWVVGVLVAIAVALTWYLASRPSNRSASNPNG